MVYRHGHRQVSKGPSEGVVAGTGQSSVAPALAIYALPMPTKLGFGPQDGLFADLARLGKARGLDVYVLTPGHLDEAARVAWGYKWDAKERSWRLERRPWPQVWMRRVTWRPAPVVETMERDYDLLAQSGAKEASFPRPLSEKWTVHRLLSENSELRPHLPATVLAQRPFELLNAVQSWGDVYIKPVRGTHGWNVTRVVLDGHGYRVRESGQNREFFLSTDRELLRHFNLSGSSGALIAQRTVSLIRTAKGEPLDLRYLIQRGDGGKQHCTAVIARVAGSESVTTNVHTGAVAMKTDRAEERLPLHARAAFREAVARGLMVAQRAFAELCQYHENLAELGIDIAVDSWGKVYILEVNPVPGRRMLRVTDSRLRLLSLERLVEYAVWCMGYSGQAKGGRSSDR